MQSFSTIRMFTDYLLAKNSFKLFELKVLSSKKFFELKDELRISLSQ